jgi:hypothetical protein
MNNNKDKHTFWHKVKSSTKTITSTLGNLSLRTEHDGDTAESTLIHKALVRHYTEQGKGYPEWLGHVEEKQPVQSVHQQPDQQQQQHQRTAIPSQRVEPNRYRRQNSFKDIYNQQTPTSTAQAQPTQAQNTARNAMKDRLKRNNYKSNFAAGQ